MDLPPALIDRLSPLTGDLRKVQPRGSHHGVRHSQLDGAHGRFFLKWGGLEARDGLQAERDGLDTLQAAASPLGVASVVGFGACESEMPCFLLLEWVDDQPPKPKDWTHLGCGLAHLHSTGHPSFGYGRDNCLGASIQQNSWASSWADFFWQHRILPQVTTARDKGCWLTRWNDALAVLENHLPDWLPDGIWPSLIHGDLWRGNVRFALGGPPTLIDPAVYYGHHEAELAMTTLFGGFPEHFYRAYAERLPPEPGFEERALIYQLYHLLNHLNLFGQGYAGAVDRLMSGWRRGG